MIGGPGLAGSRISTRNLGLVHQQTVAIADALEKIGAENYVADEVLVKLNDAELGAEQFTSEYGCRVQGLDAKLGAGRLVQMGLPPALSLPEALALLSSDPRVEYAELNSKDISTAEASQSEAAPVRIAVEKDGVAIGDYRLKRRLVPL